MQDWVYTDGAGDLDECNGVIINGEYAYFITDSFPFIPRCHMGETVEYELPGGGARPGGEEALAPGGEALAPSADAPGSVLLTFVCTSESSKGSRRSKCS